MRRPDATPAPLSERQRAELDDLVARGLEDSAFRRLSTWVKQHTLTPWAMERLGHMLLARGDRVEAGRAFFWSGVRTGDGVTEAIVAFLRRPPAQLLTTLAPRARIALDLLPPATRRELVEHGVTEELASEILARRWKRRRWSQVLGSVVLAAMAIVGFCTTVAWLSRWLLW